MLVAFSGVSQIGAQFSTMYAREFDALVVFLARRTLDPTVAADLAAETFAIAYRAWSRLEGRSEEEVRAWLFTVGRRQVSRWLRRGRAEQRALARLGIRVPTLYEDDIAAIEERADLAALRDHVRARLDGLKAEQRDAVRLRVLEGRSYAETASVLGISEQTARARVSRGLRALRAGIAAQLPDREELRR